MFRRTTLLGLVAALLLVVTGCVTKPAASPAPPGLQGWITDMLGQVNGQRAAVGVGPLSWCPALGRAAQAHSGDQAAHNTMSHTGSDGSTIVQRAERKGYVHWTNLGENVAWGYPTVASVMGAWMNSSGHRANILSGSFSHFGAGFAKSSNGTPYWTQDFGRAGTC